MKVPALLIKGGSNVIAMLVVVGFGFIFIYCVCICLYAAVNVGVDCLGTSIGVGACVGDMIRAPFNLLVGPLSSFDGDIPPSPHPRILLMTLTISIALATIAHLVRRRSKGTS